ncbi:type VII secretion protein EccB [Phytomonospora sp. NPDC050363]|uniref:type VII secretion protein EccB n=1 Tax=Phytomonospora sp. NPDC050363 TaxID=3155642 RepID=UPI0033F91C34
MRSRKEQVQAHRFVTHRLVSALLVGDPESTETPMRRIGMSVFGSVMVMAIIAAIFGVYGIFKPGGGKPEAGTLIIEEETGVLYLWAALDNPNEASLYPVLNYASARLILNQAELKPVSMSQNSLKTLSRGLPLGIPDAPPDLPMADNLLQDAAPWQVCSSTPRPNSGNLITQVAVDNLPGGTQVSGQAMLVNVDGQDSLTYLLWNERRMRIESLAMLALGISATPTPVTAKVIESFQAGPDLRKPDIPNEGQPATKPVPSSPSNIGTVYIAAGAYYVLTDGGLVPIGQVTAKLITDADPISITPTDANAALATSGTIEPEGFPQLVPTLRDLSGPHPALCATYDAAAEHPSVKLVVYDSTPEQLVVPDNTQLIDGATTGLAERAVLPGGNGVLAQEAPLPGATSGQTIYLVNQSGTKYGLLASDSCNPKDALGYGKVTPVLIPGSILSLLPSGVTLSQPAALQKVSDIGSGASPPPAN